VAVVVSPTASAAAATVSFKFIVSSWKGFRRVLEPATGETVPGKNAGAQRNPDQRFGGIIATDVLFNPLDFTNLLAGCAENGSTALIGRVQCRKRHALQSLRQ
jgi:hypothetical protein